MHVDVFTGKVAIAQAWLYQSGRHGISDDKPPYKSLHAESPRVDETHAPLSEMQSLCAHGVNHIHIVSWLVALQPCIAVFLICSHVVYHGVVSQLWVPKMLQLCKLVDCASGWA